MCLVEPGKEEEEIENADYYYERGGHRQDLGGRQSEAPVFEIPSVSSFLQDKHESYDSDSPEGQKNRTK